MHSLITAEHLQKFSKQGPRYTSYPTAPEWKTSISSADYTQMLSEFGAKNKPLSVYVHIPFCSSMCFYCGCNVVIRKSSPEVGDGYLDLVEREIQQASLALGTKPVVKQLHFGGGTPTYLSAEQLQRLFTIISTHFELETDAEIAIEIDPRTVKKAHLTMLKTLGFNRISMGIQDFSPKVQEAVNRIQPFEMVAELMNDLRSLDFKSINMDLIYGLPYQTLPDFYHTMEQVVTLSPDRIALYSFAHIPWLKSHQKLIPETALPTGTLKLDLFIQAREQFLNSGYNAIAMDHFAKSTDEMSEAFNQGRLYRNFMGYTLKPADDFIGFGVSSIGFIDHSFIQNQKDLPSYTQAISNGLLPVEKGMRLSLDDQIRQWVISELMCHFGLDKQAFFQKFSVAFDSYFQDESPHLIEMESEGLLRREQDALKVTELGKFFVRNIAMGFDWYLRQPKAHQKFSGTV